MIKTFILFGNPVKTMAEACIIAKREEEQCNGRKGEERSQQQFALPPS